MSPLPSGLTSIDDLLGGNGYPDRSTIIIVGKAEVDKELILYPFILEGARRGDFCLYVSRHSVDEVLRDAKAAGFDLTDKGIFWIAEEGGQLKYSANDLSRLSYDIKDLLGKNRGRRIRIAADVLSSLLLFNPHETIYRFLSQLFTEFRQYHGVVIMTLDEGMHDQHAATAMEEIFDGVLCLTYNLQQGLQVELRKMKSLPVEARHRQIAIGTITPSLMNVESTQLSKEPHSSFAFHKH